MKLLCALLSLALPLPADAEDLTLPDGTVLKNYTVLKQDVDGLRIEHANGVCKVRKAALPAELAGKYQWDEKKIAVAEKFKEVQRAVREVELEEAELAAAKKEALRAAAQESVAQATATAKKSARRIGPFSVWVNYACNGVVSYGGRSSGGSHYHVYVENLIQGTAKGSFNGVAFKGSFGPGGTDDHFVFAAGETKRFVVKSILSLDGKNTVAVSFKIQGRKEINCTLPVPEAAIVK